MTEVQKAPTVMKREVKKNVLPTVIPERIIDQMSSSSTEFITGKLLGEVYFFLFLFIVQLLLFVFIFFYYLLFFFLKIEQKKKKFFFHKVS